MTGRAAAEEPPAPRELVVIKLGGTTLAEQRHVLEEVAVVRDRDLVLVHGGGVRLSEWLERLRVETRFEAGLRVTGDEALDVASAVLAGLVNTELVAALRRFGADAVGISGVDGGLLVGERVPGMGRVATVAAVRPAVVYALLAGGLLPVVAPLALDEQGIICNVNADDAAAGLAAGLQAGLVLLTDMDGVLGPRGETLTSLDADDAERLIAAGTIAGGMVPKVRAALRAAASAGDDAVIADGGAPAALSRALEDPRFGTRLRAAPAARESPGPVER